jgi:hypothetical protein
VTQLGITEDVGGKITNIQGEQYSIQGDRGQDITLRVTKDTNKVCAKGQGTQFATGQEGAKEQQEIAPTASMEKQASKGGQGASEQQTMQQFREGTSQKEAGALSKDPSKLKDVVGTTDQQAKEDVARGSGFVVGGKDCTFKAGDQVRVEASDMGDGHDHYADVTRFWWVKALNLDTWFQMGSLRPSGASHLNNDSDRVTRSMSSPILLNRQRTNKPQVT